MGNVRVYELAKELKLTNHELIDALKGMGIEVKSHSSSLDSDMVAKVKENIKG
ncbi:MAG TPA: hypothetical protein DCL60_01770, partial [Armatimonadetes bacterium]|nr:hypothetical protein [Armatimonadota bacterium]